MESGQALMRCRYCNTALAPSRSFVDGEFCCDDHRQAFEAESLSATPVAKQTDRQPVTQTVSAALQMLRRKFAPEPASPDSRIRACRSKLNRSPAPNRTWKHTKNRAKRPPIPRPVQAREAVASWRWLKAAWKGAPRDLKLVSLLPSSPAGGRDHRIPA